MGAWSCETDTKGAESPELCWVSHGPESLCPRSSLSCHAAILGGCFALFLCWASLLPEGAVHAVSRGAACVQVYTGTHRHLRLLENGFAENHCSQENSYNSHWVMGSCDPVLHSHSYLTVLCHLKYTSLAESLFLNEFKRTDTIAIFQITFFFFCINY